MFPTLLITSVLMFCYFGDITFMYTEEQWYSINEYWAMHSDRSYRPDLPDYNFVAHEVVSSTQVISLPKGVNVPHGEQILFMRELDGEVGYIIGHFQGTLVVGDYVGPTPPKEWIHDSTLHQGIKMHLYGARERVLNPESDSEI